VLNPIRIPSLFITGTDTGVGKTVVAGAIANWFARRGYRVGVLKPVATGCEHRREGLVSEDAEFLAHCADTAFPLDLVCPQTYAEPLAPAVAAERAGKPLDWSAIQRSIDLISSGSDVLIVEGVGGIRVPMDEKYDVRDMAAWIASPAIVVARPALGTINHTLLTIESLRARNIPIAGVVINRYITDRATIAEETSPRVVEKHGKTPILCLVPEESPPGVKLPAGIVAAIETVDWSMLTNRR
jgi:dethiobiotin synthetase